MLIVAVVRATKIAVLYIIVKVMILIVNAVNIEIANIETPH
jgi:hypothetical protein